MSVVVRSPEFKAGLRGLLRRPEEITESTRWLFTWLTMVFLVLCLPGVLSSARGGVLALGLAASLALTASWIYGFLSKRVPLVLDLLDAAAMTGFALACPEPAVVVMIAFVAAFLRALDGSTWRSMTRCCLYLAAIAATLPLWPLIHGGAATPSTGFLIAALPLMFPVVIIGRQLASGLLAREQGVRRDTALATTGSQLLGVTDAAAIQVLASMAMAEICAATPGLRLLQAVRDGSLLRVEGAAGGLDTVPVALPGEVITTPASPASATITNPGPLDAAVGAPLMWDCIGLAEREEDTWLLVGAPKKIPSEAMLSVRSLVNQVALALRNSEAQAQLVDAARSAGRAEIAVNVLHNVGNVLNSVNVSANLVVQKVRGSKSTGLVKAVALMREHTADLGTFITTDARGKELPGYLDKLAVALAIERESIEAELLRLTNGVAHIKEIVNAQQSLAGVSGVLESVRVSDVMEEALQMSGVLGDDRVTVIRDFPDDQPLPMDKHRVLLVLLNLIGNAMHAMKRNVDRPRQLTLGAGLTPGRAVSITVADNGEGIPAENMTRIFSHGFTTHVDGHGFGLHSSAVAAKEMGGALTVHSDGTDTGAAFTLEMPLDAEAVLA